MDVVAGVDIGGTNTKVGLFGASGEWLHRASFPTFEAWGSAGGVHAQLDRLADRIRSSLRAVRQENARLIAVGIGVPGMVDSGEGVVRDATNLRWECVRLAEEMEARLAVPVCIDHDVRTITRGEWLAGRAVGCSDFVCVALGTGVAAGLVAGGRLIEGARHGAGEIGHDPVPGWHRPCVCGKVGCLETIASAPGIAALAEEVVREGRSTLLAATDAPITAKTVHAACEQGDGEAKRIFRFAGEALGAKLATVVSLLDPRLIVIGGGLAAAGDCLLEPLRQTLRERALPGAEPTPVLASRLGDDAGMIGAARFAMSRRQAEPEDGQR